MVRKLGDPIKPGSIHILHCIHCHKQTPKLYTGHIETVTGLICLECNPDKAPSEFWEWVNSIGVERDNIDNEEKVRLIREYYLKDKQDEDKTQDS